MNVPLRYVLAVALGLFLAVPAAAGDGRQLAIRNAAIFDAATGTMLPERTILIQGERIAAVGSPDRPLAIPDGADVVDASGKYVIPGLIDAHVHLVHLADRTHVTGDEFLPLFLAAGVTSVRSAGDAIVPETSVARFAARHPELCPSVFPASPLVDGDPPFHRDVGYALTDPAKVAAFVDDMAAWNVVTLKIYVGTPRDIGRELIAQGHRRGMRVTAHLGRYSAQDAAADGIDCLEHIWSVFNYSIPSEVAGQPDHRAGLDLNNPKCQSLLALSGAETGERGSHAGGLSQHDLLKRPEGSARPSRRGPRPKADVAVLGKLPCRQRALARNATVAPNVKSSSTRNSPACCTVCTSPCSRGPTLPSRSSPPAMRCIRNWRCLLNRACRRPRPSRRQRSITPRIVNQAENLGSIEPGKTADLLILTRDPTRDIRHTRSIERVIHRGRVTVPETVLKAIPAE